MNSFSENEAIRDKAYRINETIIVFIGLGMFWMPGITSFFGGTVPREFLFGATLSSFLLALSDSILIAEKMTTFKIWAYGLSFISGILSVIYLPVVLEMYPEVLDILNPMTTDLTLMALGFILMIVGFRSFTYKSYAIREIRTELSSAKEELKDLFVQLRAAQKSNEKLAYSISEKSEQFHVFGNELKRLKNENIRLKKEIQKIENM